MLISPFLKTFIRAGTLCIEVPGQAPMTFKGTEPGPEVTIRLHDKSLTWQLALNPDPGFGDAYMDGRVTIEKGSLRDLMWIINRNIDLGREGASALSIHISRWLGKIRGFWRLYNPRKLARKKVSHHYDLTGDLFALFLDDDRQYSCAYFAAPDDSLETAQARKKHRLAQKLCLKPNQRLLDVGSGWGGLGLYLHEHAGCDVTGVTLSHEQQAYAEKRANDGGVSDAVRFLLRDYRDVADTFDRIVSVGMFEHVGPRHYGEFFNTLARLLDDDGVAVLHSIGRYNPPETNSAWIEKHIFPGAYTPALSEVLPHIERAGLWVTDIEIMRVHYAETLKHWYERFQKNRAKAKALYDEKFCRMWEFYLTGCEMAFRTGALMVFQIQFAKKRDAVPLTRDYMSTSPDTYDVKIDRSVA